jgi:sugar/nucleoside kinase (ribokinase family)
MRELICFGEITLDTIGSSGLRTEVGSAAILDELGTCYGGRGANVATFFALWRPGAALVSAAGEDFVRAGHRDLLERLGVDCSEVLIETDRPTPRAFVFRTGPLDQAVSQTFFFKAVNAAGDEALTEHVRRVAERGRARIVYCTSGRQDLNLHLLTRLPSELKAYAPGPQIFHYPKTELEPFLEAADALFLNEAEAAYLRRTMGLGSAALNEAFRLAFHVVTRGAGGCVLHEGTRDCILPACRPEAEVDPTGAGDAFAGTFLAEYLGTGNARAAAELALAVSSFVVERLGCQESLPTPEAARERLRAHKEDKRERRR